jgi:hypothetical protein
VVKPCEPADQAGEGTRESGLLPVVARRPSANAADDHHPTGIAQLSCDYPVGAGEGLKALVSGIRSHHRLPSPTAAVASDGA